jgi:hypothetical protein
MHSSSGTYIAMSRRNFSPAAPPSFASWCPWNPASGFTNYESRLADAAKEKHWDEVPAYVTAGAARMMRSKPAAGNPISRRKSARMR